MEYPGTTTPARKIDPYLLDLNKYDMRDFKSIHDKHVASRAKRLQKPLKSFLVLLPALTTETQERLKKLPAPSSLCGVDCPKNLQQVTYGVLCKLQQAAKASNFADVITSICDTLLDVEAVDVMNAPADKVLGVVFMVSREMERIAKLFNSVHREPSVEEQQAGVDDLNFGVFGTADWYARRMGITDHEEVFKTPWQRIYQCLKMDAEQAAYEERLRKVYENKNKRR